MFEAFFLKLFPKNSKDFKKQPQRSEKRKIGDKGEDVAAKYLKRHGYRILYRNYTFDKAEIDIVAKNRHTVVFVEVKTTSSDLSESIKPPSSYVDERKKQNLIKAARSIVYDTANKSQAGCDYRFDVIEVYLNRKKPEINHIENAFRLDKRNMKKRF